MPERKPKPEDRNKRFTETNPTDFITPGETIDDEEEVARRRKILEETLDE